MDARDRTKTQTQNSESMKAGKDAGDFDVTGKALRIMNNDRSTDTAASDLALLAAGSVYEGTPDNDSIPGSDGDDKISGLGGDDSLAGAGGNDLLIGGTGNDNLQGNAGSDTYRYTQGDGNDVIDDESPSTTDIDVLRLVDLDPGEVTISRNTTDLFVTDNATGSVITVRYQYFSGTENWGIEQIAFASGSVWNAAQILANAAFRGTTGDDTIWTASAANDTIIGGHGNDILRGDSGGDTYVYAHGDGSDIINDQSGSTIDVDTLQLTDLNAAQVELSRSDSTLVVRDISNGSTITVYYQFFSTTENWGIERIKFADGTIWNAAQILANAAFRGTDGNDTIPTYSSGNDTLIGGKGDDILRGEGGSDTYVYAHGDGSDIITDQSASTTDVDTLYLVDLNPSQITLSKVESTLYLWDLSNGASIAVYDQYFSPTEKWGIEQIKFADGTIWNATQFNAHFATLGTSDSDVMPGTAGADKLAGGAGNDTYIVNNPGDTILEYLDQGFDTVQSSVTYKLAENVENLILTGSAAIDGTGNGLNNKLTGNSAANVLDGGAGDDTMIGGGGNDTYIIDSAGDVVTEASGGGTDTVLSSVTVTALAGAVEKLILTGSETINGTGNSLMNTITGNSADNVLNGSSGADTLIGGAGNDTYMVDNAGDTIVENADEGTDLVKSTVSYSLETTANVENATVNTSTGRTLTGNALNNLLTGNSGNDTLNGGVGNDQLNGAAGGDALNGGEGVDTASYAGSNAAVTVNLLTGVGSGGHAAGDTWLSIENLTGSSFADFLTGTAADNLLDGGAGNDAMTGGKGNDTYIVDNSGDVVTEASGGGTDTVFASVTWTAGAAIENLILTGDKAIDATGNSNNNTITGNSADNVLNGSSGSDTLIGGGGNDTFIVDNAGDVIVEGVDAGIDLVKSTVSFSLETMANVENALVNTGTGRTLIGNASGNGLTGNSGGDTLEGRAGNDLLDGATGNDSLFGNADDDTLIGGSGNDSLTGGTGHDTLSGGAGSDLYLMGRGDGTDIIQNADTGGGLDILKFDIGVARDQLWFTQSGNNLVVSIIGTDDSATIQGWYSGANNQMDKVQIADGSYLNTTDVQALQSAMAAFSPPPLGQTTLDPTVATALAPTLAASWH
jgi:Ca2+-binding RTX toxin-like protein